MKHFEHISPSTLDEAASLLNGGDAVLSAEETEEELLLAALRTSDGIGFDAYRERFGKDFLSQYGEAIASLDRSTYTMDSSRFALTEKGFMALDWIILRLAAGL